MLYSLSFPLTLESPGVCADLVVAGHGWSEDAGSRVECGRLCVGGGVGVPVVVHVLSPARDGPGSTLLAGGDDVVTDNHLVPGRPVGVGGGPRHLIDIVLQSLGLSYQIGHLH